MSEKFLRLPEVVARTGLSRATIYRRVKNDEFPKPIQLGNDHVVAWIEAEIIEWQRAQIRAARGEPIHATA